MNFRLPIFFCTLKIFEYPNPKSWARPWLSSCLPITCLRDGALLDHESILQDYDDTYVDTEIATTVPCTVYHCAGDHDDLLDHSVSAS
jgi:hypothetical protein